MINQSKLKELFYYDPDTGLFTRKKKTNKRTVIGSVAGTKTYQGYITITIDKKLYRAHRLAFLYMNGSLPIHDVDHIDGNPSNNSWRNLRDVLHHENLQNQKLAKSHNKSGLLGVSWSRQAKKFVSQIIVDKKRHHLGYFDNKQVAHEAYLTAKRQLHKCCTI